MMLFLPREAMTTAEPPEPLYFSACRIHCMQTNSSEDWRPGGEAHWSPLVSIRGSISIILAAAWPLHFGKSIHACPAFGADDAFFGAAQDIQDAWQYPQSKQNDQKQAIAATDCLARTLVAAIRVRTNDVHILSSSYMIIQ